MTTAMDRVSCHIWGAGAPAKTKKDVRRVGEYFFRGKVRPFPYLAKQVNNAEGDQDRFAISALKKDFRRRRARPWDW